MIGTVPPPRYPPALQQAGTSVEDGGTPVEGDAEMTEELEQDNIDEEANEPATNAPEASGEVPQKATPPVEVPQETTPPVDVPPEATPPTEAATTTVTNASAAQDTMAAAPSQPVNVAKETEPLAGSEEAKAAADGKKKKKKKKRRRRHQQPDSSATAPPTIGRVPEVEIE